ncbi:hypothetical protein, partial [Piscinibacter koreensis]|uniref:hypothetical protein n=1 Tax=Piscinibacter koreensis TaxID=2742824 RepID=UPI001C379BDE
RGRLGYDELIHSRASVIVHDRAETASAITSKRTSTIAEMRTRPMRHPSRRRAESQTASDGNGEQERC